MHQIPTYNKKHKTEIYSSVFLHKKVCVFCILIVMGKVTQEIHIMENSDDATVYICTAPISKPKKNFLYQLPFAIIHEVPACFP